MSCARCRQQAEWEQADTRLRLCSHHAADVAPWHLVYPLVPPVPVATTQGMSYDPGP